MEIIIPDKTYISGENKNKFKKELYNDFKILSQNISIKETDIGHGADWPAIILIIAIFLQGDNLNNNIEGWFSMAKKFVKLMSKFKNSYIDKDASSLIVINDIIKIYNKKIESIYKVQSNTIPVAPFLNRSDFDSKPFSLYIHQYKINEEIVYIYGIKSNGKIVFKYSIDTQNYLMFDEAN